MFKKIFIPALFSVITFCIVLILSTFVISAQTNTVWDGSTANSFDSGSGTKSDPYIIKTPEELAFFAKSVNSGNSYAGEYIKLGADIVVNDEVFAFDADSGLVNISDGNDSVWIGTGIFGDKSGPNDTFDSVASVCGQFYGNAYLTEIGNYLGVLNSYAPIGKSGYVFSGVFDGDGHTVSGLYINDPLKYGRGLFGYVEDAHIENVKVENSYIYGRSYVGSVVGNASFSEIER